MVVKGLGWFGRVSGSVVMTGDTIFDAAKEHIVDRSKKFFFVRICGKMAFLHHT